MRRAHRIIAAIVVAFLLGSCSAKQPTTIQTAANFINRQNVVHTTKEFYAAKDPKKITVFTQEKTPYTAYRVIGKATISKYNLLGLKREETTLKEMMKNLAASIGGDGIIDIHNNNDALQATIIQYQKILL